MYLGQPIKWYSECAIFDLCDPVPAQSILSDKGGRLTPEKGNPTIVPRI